jgi:subtilisin family serine protease
VLKWPAGGAAALAGAVALLSTASPALSGPSPHNVGDVICTVDALIGSPLQVQCPSASPAAQPSQTPAGGFAPQSRRDELAPDLITARFVPGARDDDVANLLDRLDATSVTSIPELDVRSLRVEPDRLHDALLRLQKSELVARAEQERLVPLIDLTTSDAVDGDWGPRLIRVPRAWDVTRGSSKVIVAVLDTGVDTTHPDLQGSFVAGYDIIDGDAVPDDEHGHGTAVAGIIGARVSAAGQSGLCPACSLMSIRILDARGYGTTSTIAAGIVRAVNGGARVLNLSVGSTGSTETMADAVRYGLDHGAVLVAAAGNDGLQDAMYPAAYPGVISVGASDESDRLYSWSNYGAKVLLAAPGCNTAPLFRSGRAYFCGTSSATPIVAGIAALALSANVNTTSREIERALERSAIRIQGVRSGRVDAARTVEPFTPQHVRIATSNRVGPGSPRLQRFVAGAGLASVVLTGSGRSTLTLELLDSAGLKLASIGGRRPIGIKRTLAAGSYTLRISSNKPSKYRLQLDYVRP